MEGGEGLPLPAGARGGGQLATGTPSRRAKRVVSVAPGVEEALSPDSRGHPSQGWLAGGAVAGAGAAVGGTTGSVGRADRRAADRVSGPGSVGR